MIERQVLRKRNTLIIDIIALVKLTVNNRPMLNLGSTHKKANILG